MSSFGDDLIQTMTEALLHAKGEGPAIVHVPIALWEATQIAKVHEAVADPRPAIPHDQVIQKARALIINKRNA